MRVRFGPYGPSPMTSIGHGGHIVKVVFVWNTLLVFLVISSHWSWSWKMILVVVFSCWLKILSSRFFSKHFNDFSLFLLLFEIFELPNWLGDLTSIKIKYSSMVLWLNLINNSKYILWQRTTRSLLYLPNVPISKATVQPVLKFISIWKTLVKPSTYLCMVDQKRVSFIITMI